MTEMDQAAWEAAENARFDREHVDRPIQVDDQHLTSHQRISRRFANYASARVAYVNGTGWHEWDGTRWAPDPSEVQVNNLFEQFLKATWGEARNDSDLERDLKSAMTSHGTKGTLELAAKKLFFDQVDADPWMLNTPSGTLDLHSLTIRRHDPADRLTKITRGGLTGQQPRDRWSRFLDSSLPDPEIRGYLQRYAGLALIGEVIEHRLVCAVGKVGRNGKGTFAESLSYALGDYAFEAPSDMLISARPGQRESAGDLAQKMLLRGARWVIMSELEEGQHLNESKMKYLTGGDTINAKLMYQNPINFEPSHTLFMLTNHLPKVQADSAAAWARIKVIPFERSFTGSEDLTLKSDLKLAADDLIAWAVEGLRLYQQDGRLREPEAVEAATERYRWENDSVARFISEMFEVTGDPSDRVTRAELADAYSGWAIRAQADSLTPRQVTPRVERLRHDYSAFKSIGESRTGGARWWTGLRLLTDETL